MLPTGPFGGMIRCGPGRPAGPCGQRGPIHIGPVAAELRHVIEWAAGPGVTEVDQPGHSDRRVRAGGDEDVTRYQIAVA